MDKKTRLSKLISDQGIVPLYFSASAEVSISLMKALYHGGMRTLEYANRGEGALQIFKQMRIVCDRELPGMYLGIGTVKNADSAQSYVDEGAEFLVCPGIIAPVLKVAEKSNLLCVPGCMTPTDMIQAEALGAKIIKLYPANTLGPGYLDAITPVFNDLLFMPTGGIELNEENLTKWFKSGAVAVGGSKLITKTITENKQYDQLSIDAKDALKLIESVRGISS